MAAAPPMRSTATTAEVRGSSDRPFTGPSYPKGCDPGAGGGLSGPPSPPGRGTSCGGTTSGVYPGFLTAVPFLARGGSTQSSHHQPRPLMGRVSPASARRKRARSRRRMARRNRQSEYQSYQRGSAVTVIRPDGTTYIQEPHDEKTFQRIVRVRARVSDALRRSIARRDGWRCRYCGSVDGPFEIDHVVPIALGGSNRLHNLVLACQECNGRKGARVWKPRPVEQAASLQGRQDRAMRARKRVAG